MIDAAFVEDVAGGVCGLDAVEEFADGLVVAGFEALGGRGEGNVRGQPFGQSRVGAAEAGADVDAAQAGEEVGMVCHGLGPKRRAAISGPASPHP
jgi:hypothetical protein